MDNETLCPFCHVSIRPTDYFCYNCGKNLHPAPPSLSISSQILLYAGSIFLTPLGIFWGIKYIRQPRLASKIVGLIAVGLSIFTLIIVIQLTVSIFNMFNSQTSNELQMLQGL